MFFKIFLSILTDLFFYINFEELTFVWQNKVKIKRKTRFREKIHNKC